MIRLYSASDPLQAHVLRGALEAAGIHAEVRQDALFSTRGETPVTFDTLPEIWIEESDLDAARQVVAELEQTPAGTQGAPWTCHQCGETVEAQYSRCWNCGSADAAPEAPR